MSSNSLEAAVAPAPGSTTEEFELEQQNRCQEEEPRSGSATPDAMANVVTLEDVPPDGGYGWVITACVFLANSHTWGINSSWAVLLGMYLAFCWIPI